MWHNRLLHTNFHVLSTLFKSSSLDNKISFVSFDCTICKFGKSKTLSFHRNASRVNHCYDIVHSDLLRDFLKVFSCNYKYFITFIDNYNRFTWVYFVRFKAKVFCFSMFCLIA